jgi:hypothetical protein
MTVFGFFESVSELLLFAVVPLLLTVATIWILWHLKEKANPVEAKKAQSISTFILVVVPFVMFVYFGLAAVVYDATNVASGVASVLPLEPQSSQPFLCLAALYIGQSVWLWSHWRKL